MTQYESSVSSRGASDDALWVVLVAISSSGSDTRRTTHVGSTLLYCCTVVILLLLSIFHFDLLPTDLAWNTIYYCVYYLYYMCAYWYPDILVQCNNDNDWSPPACNLLAESSFSKRNFYRTYKREMNITIPSHRNHYRQQF